MPTPRQRWPYGAENARRESAELAATTEQRLRELEGQLDRLLAEIGHLIPTRYGALLREAHTIAVRSRIDQLHIQLHLERARNGSPNGTTDPD
jgi:hypothetical protein